MAVENVAALLSFSCSCNCKCNLEPTLPFFCFSFTCSNGFVIYHGIRANGHEFQSCPTFYLKS